MGQLIASLLSGVPSPPFLSSLLLSSLFVHIEVAGRCGAGGGKARLAAPCRSQPNEGAPNKFCVSPPQRG